MSKLHTIPTRRSSDLYQATGDSFYREVVEETLAYVLREMTSPEGPFYSTQDADSEGVEGKFFVWTLAEVEKILGDRKSTRLNSSHRCISYAVFCLKTK